MATIDIAIIGDSCEEHIGHLLRRSASPDRRDDAAFGSLVVAHVDKLAATSALVWRNLE
jgi:hypothetical protein